MNKIVSVDDEEVDNGGAIALKGFNYQNAVASLIAILNYDKDNFLLFIETKDDIEVDIEDKPDFIYKSIKVLFSSSKQFGFSCSNISTISITTFFGV